MSHIVFIGLGANLGRRISYLQEAVRALDAHEAFTVQARSSVYESAAHTLDPAAWQPSYLNAVIQGKTSLTPGTLLRMCHRIEQRLGRYRRTRWAPRTLDLDVLLYGKQVVQEQGLVIPHPRMGERRFVLQPLHELAPQQWVPAPFSTTVERLLIRCPDTERLVQTAYVLP